MAVLHSKHPRGVAPSSGGDYVNCRLKSDALTLRHIRCGSRVDAQAPGSLQKTDLFAIESHETACSPIGSLRASVSPSAVCRFVAAVIVDPVDGGAVGPFPHVGEEVVKTPPAFAHGDATMRVARGVLLPICSREQAFPRSISGRSRHAMAQSRLPKRRDKPVVAAAGFCIAGNKRTKKNSYLFPTIAFSQHLAMLLSGGRSSLLCFRLNNEIPKPLSAADF